MILVNLLLFHFAMNGIINLVNFLTPLRVSKISSKYMGGTYDASKPTKYITYLDAKNVYRWAKSKPFPTQGFKWMEPNELENWRNYSCILEVDFGVSRKSPRFAQRLSAGSRTIKD